MTTHPPLDPTAGENAPPARTAGQRYLAGVAALLDTLLAAEWPAISAAAACVADTVAADGLVHVVGTGHSHMLAEELFYRAGGLAAVNPLLVDSLMLHTAAEASTRLERTPGLGRALFPGLGVRRGDTCLVASNSGGNAVCVEIAELARDAGASVVAILSRRHAAHAGDGTHARLAQVADVVIDNHGRVGDASTTIAGFPRAVGPTSTVAGAAIVNAVVAEAVERLVARGVTPDVFSSSNVAGGDEVNAALAAAYRTRVRML